jgi:predicted DNA-binding protein
MAQTSVVIPDDLYELLQKISTETGRSISGLCAGYIEDGIYTHIEKLNKVEVWQGQLAKRKQRQSESIENQ